MSEKHPEVPLAPHYSLPELEAALQQLTQHVSEEKQLIKDKFHQIHQMVSQRQTQLMAQLDAIPAGISVRIEQRKASLKQLSQERTETETKLQTDKLNESLLKQLSDINTEISRIQSERIPFPQVSLRCDKDRIQTVLENRCLIQRTVNDYSARARIEPVWHSVKKGEGANELYHPSAICVDPATQLIYVGEDCITQRIQVFTSEGKHYSTLRNEELLFCHSLKIHREHIYVCTGMLGMSYLLKLNKSGKTLKGMKTDNEVFGLCIDGEDLYTCSSKSLTLQTYDLGLEPNRKILLKARSFGNHTTPRDLFVSKREIFVLFSFYSLESYQLDPVQVFQLDGVLLRSLAIGNLIKNALYFCLDASQNILVSDFSAHCIRILSPDGSLIHSIGRAGRDQAGELYNPTGLTVDCRDRILTVGRKQDNLLQAFLVSNS